MTNAADQQNNLNMVDVKKCKLRKFRNFLLINAKEEKLFKFLLETKFNNNSLLTNLVVVSKTGVRNFKPKLGALLEIIQKYILEPQQRCEIFNITDEDNRTFIFYAVKHEEFMQLFFERKHLDPLFMEFGFDNELNITENGESPLSNLMTVKYKEPEEEGQMTVRKKIDRVMKYIKSKKFVFDERIRPAVMEKAKHLQHENLKRLIGEEGKFFMYKSNAEKITDQQLQPSRSKAAQEARDISSCQSLVEKLLKITFTPQHDADKLLKLQRSMSNLNDKIDNFFKETSNSNTSSNLNAKKKETSLTQESVGEEQQPSTSNVADKGETASVVELSTNKFNDLGPDFVDALNQEMDTETENLVNSVNSQQS